MPAAVPWIVAGGIGLAAGLWAAGAGDKLSTAARWAAIGTAVYVGYRIWKG